MNAKELSLTTKGSLALGLSFAKNPLRLAALDWVLTNNKSSWYYKLVQDNTKTKLLN
jgi:hypothetical protein